MIQNKTEILNLKTRKTQVPMGYLTLKNKNKVQWPTCKYLYLFTFQSLSLLTRPFQEQRFPEGNGSI
jgi:hypothetical protein